MKTFKASKFQHQPGEIFDAAREEPVVVQRCKTNGEIIEEFVVLKKCQSAVWELYQESESGDINELFSHIRVDADEFRDKAFERRMKEDADLKSKSNNRS